MQFSVRGTTLRYLRNSSVKPEEAFLYLTSKKYRESSVLQRREKAAAFRSSVLSFERELPPDFFKKVAPLFDEKKTLSLTRFVFSQNEVEMNDENVNALINGDDFVESGGEVTPSSEKSLFSYFQSNPENYDVFEYCSSKIIGVRNYLYSQTFTEEEGGEEEILQLISLQTDFTLIVSYLDEEIVFPSLRKSNPFVILRLDPMTDHYHPVGEMRGNGVYQIFLKDHPLIEKIIEGVEFLYE